MSKRICVFGDSITRGAFDLEKGGWVNRLKMYFWKNEGVGSVYEIGVSGDYATDIIRRFEIELDVMKKQFDCIIFAIGLNDVSLDDGGNREFTSDEFRKNMHCIAKRSSKRFGAGNVFFVGITNVDCAIAGQWFDNNRIKKFDGIVQEVAVQNNCRYISVFDLLDKDDLCDDGFHPNAKGHEKIFQQVKKCLVESEVVQLEAV
ncbi:MAG: hypothetical protein CR972_03300 [Candidatus Moraniibacteriota bacterium]|nr:MAG: hypothetical protein CR972_03300 [Candidatus Moranbacteria bacterium]